MLIATHSKWLPVSKSHQTANHGQNPQTTTTRSQLKVLPTSTSEQLEQGPQHHRHLNRNNPTTPTTKFIQLKAPNSASGRPILVRRQRPQQQPQLRPFFLKNCEILSQESLAQLINQNQLLNQANLLTPNQLLHHRLSNRIPREEEIIDQSSPEEQDQETITPVYSIISVPFLARSYLPISSTQQRNPKTNGLVKTKQIAVNSDRKNGQKLIFCQNQKSTSAHLNLSNQQKNQHSSRSSSSQLNTVQKSKSTLNTTVCNNISQLNTAIRNSNTTTPISLNTSRTSVTRNSAEMMGIHLPGSEFQDMNSTLPIAAVEELMGPVCLDDYIIETNNNNSDFEANNGTFKLQGLNEMTINQTNENYAEQLQQQFNETQDEERFMKEVPGEEQYFSNARQLHSEELISLSQPSLGHMPECEPLFPCDMFFDNLVSHSDDSLENSSTISPGSPVPTENDCIATSKLHTHKPEISLHNSSMQDDETTCRIQFSPNQSEEQYNTDDEHMKLIMEILDEPSVQPNLKRNSDHLTDIKYLGAKKTRLNIPTLLDTSVGSVLATPEVCNMVLTWQQDNDGSMYSHSPSLYGSIYSPEESCLPEQLNTTETNFDNPPSIPSSYICEEPSYATPSPSNSSNYTVYSTNPSSPAVSTYSNGAKKKSRGRPPKQHSDRPDPKILSTLSGIDRKRYEDRCKNNEASRQSRQKNKQKLQEMEAEEDRENNKNYQLKKKLNSLDKRHEKLKNALYLVIQQT